MQGSRPLTARSRLHSRELEKKSHKSQMFPLITTLRTEYQWFPYTLMQIQLSRRVNARWFPQRLSQDVEPWKYVALSLVSNAFAVPACHLTISFSWFYRT